MFSSIPRTLRGFSLSGLLLITSCGSDAQEDTDAADATKGGDSSAYGGLGGGAPQRTERSGGTSASAVQSAVAQSSVTGSGGSSRASENTRAATVPGGGTSARIVKATGGTPTTGGTSQSMDTKTKGGTSSRSTKAAGGAAQGGAASAPTTTAGTGNTGKGGTSASTRSVTSAGGRPRVTAASGATLVKIDSATKHQKFEGWGTSLCWWAYQLGGWSEAKRNQFLDLIVNPSSGLGYNIFRYNIGGGDAPSHNHMGTNREMPGFQSNSGTWDWNADARQTSVLKRIAATAKDLILEAFSNSPPYWMTKSGCASGNTDGSNNLKDDSYGAFADYLTEVVKHYRDELGITFRTLEPMNEPNANWWKANGSQEGCHFSASNQQQIIKAVGAALTTKGLTDTRISASDENSMDDAYSIMSGYDSATLGYVAQMNVHSYAGSRRTQLRTLANDENKRLWQSESGPLSVTLDTNLDAAIFMAGRIITDLRELKPEAWIEWQIVDPAQAWTSFTVNDTKESWTPLKRFYAQAAFSRFIRPGATFVAIDNPEMVAALAADGSTLSIVVRNGDKTATKSFTFDLTSLPSLGSSIDVYRTSQNEDLAHLPSIPIKDWSFSVSAAPYSVTTYVIPITTAAASD